MTEYSTLELPEFCTIETEETTSFYLVKEDDDLVLICEVDTKKFNDGMENGVLNNEVRKAITTGMIAFDDFMEASNRIEH